jgi:hypothetical protein
VCKNDGSVRRQQALLAIFALASFTRGIAQIGYSCLICEALQDGLARSDYRQYWDWLSAGEAV